MRLVHGFDASVKLYHLSDVLTKKYNLKFHSLLKLYIKFEKPSMIKFENILKEIFVLKD